MSSRTIRSLVVTALAAALFVVAGASAEAAPTSGFNDPACRPSAEHPNPLVLIHGLGAPEGRNFSYLGPELAAAGYCAFAIDYGTTAPSNYFGGFQAMDDSAADIRAFITEIRDLTGADEVDLVGHSEGALHSLYVPKKFGLGDEVGRVVAIAPPTHGTDASGLFTVARSTGLIELGKPLTALAGCTACDEIAISEEFIDKLNDGPIAVDGIDYTIIASTNDRIVTPYQTSFVDEPGVVNLTVQDLCPFDPVGHVGLAFDPGVRHMITNALDPSTATPVACSFGPPL